MVVLSSSNRLLITAALNSFPVGCVRLCHQHYWHRSISVTSSFRKGQAGNVCGAILPPAVLTGEAGGIWPAGMVSLWELISLEDYRKQDI